MYIILQEVTTILLYIELCFITKLLCNFPFLPQIYLKISYEEYNGKINL